MSLSSHLDDPDSPVRGFLYGRFPDTRRVLNASRERLVKITTIRPAINTGVPYSTIGTALDYRLRYYFAVSLQNELVAADGAALLSPARGQMVLADGTSVDLDLVHSLFPIQTAMQPSEGRRAAALTPDFFVSLRSVLLESRPVQERLDRAEEERLCQHCFVLALFEQLFRAGLGVNSPLYTLGTGARLSDLLALAKPEWVDDLCNLSWAFHEQFAQLLSQPAILNPTFAGSEDIGGADADLILDGCLIDIKATVDPRRHLDRSWLYQLLGYVLLDYADQYRIHDVAIYLAANK